MTPATTLHNILVIGSKVIMRDTQADKLSLWWTDTDQNWFVSQTCCRYPISFFFVEIYSVLVKMEHAKRHKGGHAQVRPSCAHYMELEQRTHNIPAKSTEVLGENFPASVNSRS